MFDNPELLKVDTMAMPKDFLRQPHVPQPGIPDSVLMIRGVAAVVDTKSDLPEVVFEAAERLKRSFEDLWALYKRHLSWAPTGVFLRAYQAERDALRGFRNILRGLSIMPEATGGARVAEVKKVCAEIFPEGEKDLQKDSLRLWLAVDRMLGVIEDRGFLPVLQRAGLDPVLTILQKTHEANARIFKLVDPPKRSAPESLYALWREMMKRSRSFVLQVSAWVDRAPDALNDACDLLRPFAEWSERLKKHRNKKDSTSVATPPGAKAPVENLGVERVVEDLGAEMAAEELSANTPVEDPGANTPVEGQVAAPAFNGAERMLQPYAQSSDHDSVTASSSEPSVGRAELETQDAAVTSRIASETRNGAELTRADAETRKDTETSRDVLKTRNDADARRTFETKDGVVRRHHRDLGTFETKDGVVRVQATTKAGADPPIRVRAPNRGRQVRFRDRRDRDRAASGLSFGAGKGSRPGQAQRTRRRV